MDHPGAAQLQPPAGQFHRDLQTGFDEGEEIGTEPHFRLRAEEAAGNACQRACKIGQGDIAPDPHAINLVEGVVVGRVNRLVSKAPAAGEDREWGIELGHQPALEAGGVGAQEKPVVDVEGSLFIQCGMFFGEVQRGEVEPVFFHLGILRLTEPEGAHQVRRLLEGDGYRVRAPCCRRAAGPRDIHAFISELSVELGGGKLRSSIIHDRLQGAFEFVDTLAEGRTLARRYPGDEPHQARYTSLSAQEIIRRLFKLGERSGSGQRLGSAFAKLIQFVHKSAQISDPANAVCPRQDAEGEPEGVSEFYYRSIRLHVPRLA